MEKQKQFLYFLPQVNVTLVINYLLTRIYIYPSKFYKVKVLVKTKH